MNINDRINIYCTELNFETSILESTGEEQYKAPTKIMLLPTSPIVGRNGRRYTFDVEELLSNFQSNNLKLPIDINHATELKAPMGEPSPAYGWVISIEADVEGNIWGNVDWNSEYILKYKEYKYYSPALRSDISGKISRINSIGLVNKPNFELGALNFEQEIINKQGESKMEVDKDILKSLGLPEDAGKDAVIQTIHGLKTNQTEQTKLVEQVNTLNMELHNVKSSALNEKKMQAVENAAKNGKIAPSTKEFYINTLNSEDALQSFIETMDKAPSFMTNAITQPKGNGESTSLNFEQSEHCKKYGLTEEEFKKKREELFS